MGIGDCGHHKFNNVPRDESCVDPTIYNLLIEFREAPPTSLIPFAANDCYYERDAATISAGRHARASAV